MFQLYRDALEDLLVGGVAPSLKKKKKAASLEDEDKPPNLRIVLAEHSPTGLVQVEGAETIVAESAAEVMRIFAVGEFPTAYYDSCIFLLSINILV